MQLRKVSTLYNTMQTTTKLNEDYFIKSIDLRIPLIKHDNAPLSAL